jgi:hypothetical protein
VQLGHVLGNPVPHWLQNREPAAFSVPQLEQRMVHPKYQTEHRVCITELTVKTLAFHAFILELLGDGLLSSRIPAKRG